MGYNRPKEDNIHRAVKQSSRLSWLSASEFLTRQVIKGIRCISELVKHLRFVKNPKPSTKAFYWSTADFTALAFVSAIQNRQLYAYMHIPSFQIPSHIDHYRASSRVLRGIQQVLLQFSSVPQLCPMLCDPMDCSMPGLPVHHQLLEFAQTHVHRVSDALQPSVVPFSSCLPSFPALGSFPMSQFFASGCPSIGVSASASVLPMNIQD